MISVYSTWWVKPEEQEALKPALVKLAKAVEANEEGTLLYLVHYPRFDFPKPKKGKEPISSEPKVRPGTIVFVEKYASWDAFETHLNGPYFTQFVKDNFDKFVLGDDGQPFLQAVFLNQEAGFTNR